MSHLGHEWMRRVLGGEESAQEAEAAAEHLVSCEHCRAQAGTILDELRAERPGLRGEGPLQLAFELIDRERRWGVESLAAIAEWSEVRRLPSRRSQRDRVRMSKGCHTLAFFHLLLAELKEASALDESEFLAALALLSIEGMGRRQLTEASQHDRQAEVWTAVANARRLAAEWKKAHQALSNAERHLKEGTGDPRLQAGLLSITASTLADQGQDAMALDALERCRAIYAAHSEWTLLARTMVQTANIFEPSEPAKGLVMLDQATPLIPADDSYLKLFADMIRVGCLLGVGRPNEALRVFRRSAHLLAAVPQIRLRIRGKFTGARLLDALGFKSQAVRLFDEVIDRDIEHDLYKDAYLDLLYLYGHHMKAGDLDKAAQVCQRALTDPVLAEAAHEQLRTLWTQLLEATRRQALSQELLSDLRRYLGAHWRHPAASPPAVAFR
jgi:tetratricopeptide (TPR) repeat protein